MDNLSTETICAACAGTGQKAIADGTAMRRAREAAGLSLRSMGERLNLSAVYLSDIERGRRGCTERVLRAYQDLCGLPGHEGGMMPSSERLRLVARAAYLRAEIEQIFVDAASWNANTRAEGEEPIDADPDGQLRRIADGLDRLLASEAGR